MWIRYAKFKIIVQEQWMGEYLKSLLEKFNMKLMKLKVELKW